MAKSGPEAKLIKKMKDEAEKKYGDRLVITKYHGSQYAQSGVSDLLCSLDGMFVACEVKAPESYGGSVERALEKGPTVLQREYVNDVLSSGGVAGFAATVEQFMEILYCAAEDGSWCGECCCDGHNI